MRIDAAILAAVVAFLLPLRLLSLLARLSLTGSAGDLRRPCAAFALSAALLAAIFALPRDHARECAAASVVVPDDGEGAFRGEVRSDIEQLKLQLARLESMWDNNSKPLDGKSGPLEEDGEVVRAMGLDIQSLINEHENIKESLCGSYSDNTIKAMEKEIQILMDESRKMNSNIHNIWSMAKDTDNRVSALHSDVNMVLMDESRQMNSNVRELWSLAKDTERRVEGLHSDMRKVQILIDESRKMESSIYKMWSFAKQTEKRVEDLYSDVKKGFKQKGIKVPSWMDW
ncbi:uncharacterized protein [Oryza sativa Japonica Group]|uniref:uncharacterized protein isoform X2 n=1 Tax=Oryza sativa subsp. japonica TaxID=39947 RepID=UPI00077553F1|nr:uncharacterized protein LOC9266427 isoform X2 [Oryza sativa Japonica Group]KAF2944375.1 hypothetical protein DAI22_02g137900 [Oryza sativa Japonica Group]KAF2944376.1 hypothetical protein DAI22_02g137900 [Oryza sativa Japonica Group]KAF2944383.1 hypothetical protein DAI22_02g137900 [Oryza sativa Japonica Group]KAF2944387.1 hypothetical protein DAI22_02g137900 [Oryza sativa Japonica Group]